jgi:hypothetical protein
MDSTAKGRSGALSGFGFVALVSVVCSWIVVSPLLWPRTPQAGAATVAVGLFAWACALLAIARPAFRWAVALAGVAIVLPVFRSSMDRIVVVNHVISGVLLVGLSLFHTRQAQVSPTHARRARVHLLPLSVDARRFVHGLAWGAAATLAMAVVVGLAMALRIWPSAEPFSVAFGRRVLGAQVPPSVVWLLVAAGELAFGALCGGLLTVLSDEIRLSDALAMGLLRWLATQWLVFPFLGWADFGLGRGLGPALATAAPHLAYALTLGFGMRRDDRRLGRAAPRPPAFAPA